MEIPPVKNPLGMHTNCKGHKISYLEDPLETVEDRELILKILNNYWPEEK